MTDETGLRCPKCGDDKGVWITCDGVRHVMPSGEIDYQSGNTPLPIDTLSYTDKSRASCQSCKYGKNEEGLATVANFRPKSARQMLLDVVERIETAVAHCDLSHAHVQSEIQSLTNQALDAVEERGLDG